jgi:hypothetical protein
MELGVGWRELVMYEPAVEALGKEAQVVAKEVLMTHYFADHVDEVQEAVALLVSSWGESSVVHHVRSL